MLEAPDARPFQVILPTRKLLVSRLSVSLSKSEHISAPVMSRIPTNHAVLLAHSLPTKNSGEGMRRNILMSIEIIEPRPLIVYQVLIAKHAATRGTLCGLVRFYADGIRKLCASSHTTGARPSPRSPRPSGRCRNRCASASATTNKFRKPFPNGGWAPPRCPSHLRGGMGG